MFNRGHSLNDLLRLAPTPPVGQPGEGAVDDEPDDTASDPTDQPQGGEQDDQEADDQVGGGEDPDAPQDDPEPDENNDRDDEAPGEGEGKAAAVPFNLSDLDRQVLRGVMTEAAIDKLAQTPEGQAALQAAIGSQRDELVGRALSGGGRGDDQQRGGGQQPTEIDQYLDQALPEFSIADADVKALKDNLPEGVYDKTLAPAFTQLGQARKVIATIVKAHESMRTTFTTVLAGLQVENFLDSINDPTYGTSADTQLNSAQEGKRRQFADAFNARLRSLGRTPTPRDVTQALRAARTTVDAPRSQEIAVQKVKSEVNKRAAHSGALPRNGKSGAPTPKKSVAAAAAVADRFLADMNKGGGKTKR